LSSRTIIQAWKNPAYRNSLTEAERARLPANPAGSIEVSDEDFGKVAGGRDKAPDTYICTMFCTLGCTTDCTTICSFTCPFGSQLDCI
jgi:mersacidin/lichenicidin family type 2 lantibiotic